MNTAIKNMEQKKKKMIPKKLEEKKDKELEIKPLNCLIELKVKNILITILIDPVQPKKTYDLIHT